MRISNIICADKAMMSGETVKGLLCKIIILLQQCAEIAGAKILIMSIKTQVQKFSRCNPLFICKSVTLEKSFVIFHFCHWTSLNVLPDQLYTQNTEKTKKNNFHSQEQFAWAVLFLRSPFSGSTSLLQQINHQRPALVMKCYGFAKAQKALHLLPERKMR